MNQVETLRCNSKIEARLRFLSDVWPGFEQQWCRCQRPRTSGKLNLPTVFSNHCSPLESSIRSELLYVLVVGLMYRHDSWHASREVGSKRPPLKKISKLHFLLETAQNVVHIQQAAFLDVVLFRKPATRRRVVVDLVARHFLDTGNCTRKRDFTWNQRCK
jgi:hypothetical protein